MSFRSRQVKLFLVMMILLSLAFVSRLLLAGGGIGLFKNTGNVVIKNNNLDLNRIGIQESLSNASLSNTILVSNVVTNSEWYGIRMRGSGPSDQNASYTLLNNLVLSSGRSGIQIRNAGDVVLDGNIVGLSGSEKYSEPEGASIIHHGSGIQIRSSLPSLITDNELYSNWYAGISLYSTPGTIGPSNTIRNNGYSEYGCYAFGYAMPAGVNVKSLGNGAVVSVSNNLMYDNLITSVLKNDSLGKVYLEDTEILSNFPGKTPGAGLSLNEGDSGITISCDNTDTVVYPPQFAGKTLYNNPSFGIVINGATNVNIEKCNIHDNHKADLSPGNVDVGGGIFMVNGAEAVIRNNSIYNNGYTVENKFTSGQSKSAGIIIVECASANSRIASNVIFSNANNGINYRYLGSGTLLSDPTIKNNKIYSNGGVGIDIHAGLNNTVPIIENSIYNHGYFGIGLSAGNVEITNNVVYSNGLLDYYDSNEDRYLASGIQARDATFVNVSGNTIWNNIFAGIAARNSTGTIGNPAGGVGDNYIWSNGNPSASPVLCSRVGTGRGGISVRDLSADLYVYNDTALNSNNSTRDIQHRPGSSADLVYNGTVVPSTFWSESDVALYIKQDTTVNCNGGEFKGGKVWGISVVGPYKVTIENCNIHSNCASSADCDIGSVDGQKPGGGVVIAAGAEVYLFNNTIENNGYTTFNQGKGGSVGVALRCADENTLIVSNLIRNNANDGIALFDTAGTIGQTGKMNTIKSNGRHGIGLTSITGGSATTPVIAYNSIVNNAAFGIGGVSLFNMSVSIINNMILDNHIYTSNTFGNGNQDLGGGIGFSELSGTVYIEGNEIRGNKGGINGSPLAGIGFTMSNATVYLFGNTVTNNTVGTAPSIVRGAAGIGFSDFTIGNALSIANNYILSNYYGYMGGLGFENLYSSGSYTVSIVNNNIIDNGWGTAGNGALAGGVGNINTDDQISWWVENNTINNNKGLSSGAFGTKDGKSPVMTFMNNVIVGNTVYDYCNSSDCPSRYMGAGIGLLDSLTALYVDGNLFSDNLVADDSGGGANAGGAAGMYWSEDFRTTTNGRVDYFKFIGNTAYNSGRGALTVQKVRFELTDGILISNNSLNNSSVSIWFHEGTIVNGAITPFVLNNNSIINTPGTFGAVGLRDALTFDNKIHDNFVDDTIQTNIPLQGYSSHYGISNKKGVGYLSIYNNTVRNQGFAGIWVMPRGGDGSSITGTNLIYGNYVFNNGWVNSIDNATGQFLGNGIGIQEGDAVNGEKVSIYNNTVDSNRHLGIGLRQITAGVTLSSNTVRNNTRGGIGVSLTQVVGGNNILISGNLVYSNTNQHTNGVGGIGGSLVNSALSINNNQIYSNTGIQAGGIGMITATGSVVISFNNIYNNIGSGQFASAGIGFTQSNATVYLIGNSVTNNTVGTSPSIVRGAVGIGFSDFTVANALSIANNYIVSNHYGYMGGLGFENLYSSGSYTVSIVNNDIIDNGWGTAGNGALAGGVGNINTDDQISWWVENNTINNNKAKSSGAFGTKDSKSPVMTFKNNVIAGNTVFDTCPGGDCSANYMGAGIGLIDSLTALYVDGNLFSGNLPDDPKQAKAGGAAGMYWSEDFRTTTNGRVDYFKFMGNTAYNSGRGALTVQKVKFELTDGILISNNSLNNSSVSIWFHEGSFNNATGAMTPFVLNNNSIINTPGTFGAVGLRDALTFDNKIHDNFVDDTIQTNIPLQGYSSRYGISNKKGVGYLSIYNNTVQNQGFAGIWVMPRGGDGSSITGTNLIYGNYVFNNGWVNSINNANGQLLGNGIGIWEGDAVNGGKVSIYNNIVDSNLHVGIGLLQITAGVTLSSNTVRNNARGGIGIANTSVVNGDILVSGNLVYRNTHQHTNGVGGIGGSLVNSALSIYNNQIYSNTGSQEGGIGMTAANATVVITFNNIYSNIGNGLYASGGIGIKGITSAGINVQILDNTVYSNQGIYISGIGVTDSNSTLVRIVDNTVRNNSKSGIGVWNSPAVTVQNNLIVSNSWTDATTVYNGEHYASGIQQRNSTFANVTGNTIRNHLFAGIASNSSGGLIGDNLIVSNGDSGDDATFVCEGVGGNGRGGISARDLDSGEVLSIENYNITNNFVRSVQHRPSSQGTVYYNGDLVPPGTFWTGNDVMVYITTDNKTIDCTQAPYNGPPWNGGIHGGDIWGVAVMGFVTDVTIKNCDIYNNATVTNTAGPNNETVGGGVLVAAGSDVYLDNNSIFNNGYQAQPDGSGAYVGVALRCADSETTMVNNTITGNANDGIAVFDSEGYIGLSGQPNTIYNNGRHGIGLRSLEQGGSTTPVVAYNLIYSNKRFGIGVWSLNNQSPDISQNSIYNNRESGIGIRWAANPMTIRDNYIVSNGLDQIFSNNEYYASGIQARDSSFQNNSLTGNTIRNHWFAGIALNKTEGTVGNAGAGGDNYIYSNGAGTASTLCAGVGGTGHGGISARSLSNNTYVYNDTALNSGNLTRDIQHRPGSSAALIYNGTVVNSTSWTASDVAVYINSDTTINCATDPVINQISGGKIWGAAIVGEYDVLIKNCRVFDNCIDSSYCNVVSPQGQIVGGGILVAGGARVTLDNNSIYNNGHTSQTISNGGFAGVVLRCASSSTTLINNTIESNANDGIALYDTYGYIGLSGQENTIKNNGRHGIGLNSFSGGANQGPVIAYNRIFSNTAYGIGSWSLINMNASILNNLIYSNHLTNTLGMGGKDIGGGIGLVNFLSLALIKDNTIRNNPGFETGGIGISLSNGTVTISGNQIYSNANSGSGAGGISLRSLTASARAWIYGNTVYNNSAAKIGGIGVTISNSTDLSIYNNTIRNNRQTGIGIFSTASFTLQNNLLVSNGTDDTQAGDEFYASGVQVRDSTFRNNSVIGNTVRNNKFAGIAVYNSDGTIGPNNIIKYNGDPAASGSCPNIGGNGRGGVAVRDLNTGNLTVANNTVESNYYKVKSLRPGSCGPADDEFWFDNGAGGVDQVTCGGSPLPYTKIGLYITPETLVNNIGVTVTYPGGNTVINGQTLSGTSAYAIGIAVMGSISNVTITGSSIYGFGTDPATTSNLGPYGPYGYQDLGAGILIAGGAGVYIDGNSVYNNGVDSLNQGEGGYAGVMLACAGTNTTLVNNSIDYNSNDGIEVYFGGGQIGLSGQPNIVENHPRFGVGLMSLINSLNIVYNSIQNNDRGIGGYKLEGQNLTIASNYLFNNVDPADSTRGGGVMFTLYNGDAILMNNWIDSNSQGIQYNDAQGGALLIRDNTIVNQGENGINMINATSNNLNVNIENNSIANNNWNGIRFMNTTMANTYIFSNNLIHNRLRAIQFGGNSELPDQGVGDVSIVSNYMYDNEYQGLSSHDAVIRFNNIYSFLNGKDRVTIINNTIDSNNASRSAVLFQWLEDVTVTIANNTITNNSNNGIQFREGQRSGISIENNYLAGNKTGIRWQANLSTNVSVVNNVITSNSDEGLQFQYNSLGNVVIENNTLNSNRDGLIAQFNPDLTRILVNGNTARDNTKAGFAFQFNKAVSLENNILINNDTGLSLRNNDAYLGQQLGYNPVPSQFAASLVYSTAGIEHYSNLYNTYGTWTRADLVNANIFSGNNQGILLAGWENSVANATRGGAFYIANNAGTYEGSASDGSQWATPAGELAPHWIYYDLGTSKTVDKVRIKAGLEPVSWDVSVSDDALAWTWVDSFTAGGGGDLIRDWFTSGNFSAAGQFVKLESTGGADGRILDDIYMVEFEDSGVFTFYTDGSVSGAGPTVTASSEMTPPTYQVKIRGALIKNNSKTSVNVKAHVNLDMRASAVSGGGVATMLAKYGATITLDNFIIDNTSDEILVRDSNVTLRVYNGSLIDEIRSIYTARISLSNYNYLRWVNKSSSGSPGYGSIWDIENNNYIASLIRGRQGTVLYIHNNNLLTASIQLDLGGECYIYDGNKFLANGGYIQKNQGGVFTVYNNNVFSDMYIGSYNNLEFTGNTFKNSSLLIGQGGGLIAIDNYFEGTYNNEKYGVGTRYDDGGGVYRYGPYTVKGNTLDTTSLAYNCIYTAFYNVLTDQGGNICAGNACCVDNTGATLTAGPLTEPANISTTTDTETEKQGVFDFTITDSGDGLPVVIQQLDIIRGSNDTTGDWTDYLGGAKLTDSDGSVENGTVTSNAIAFGNGSSTIFSLPDTTSQTYTLSMWLKTILPTGAGGEIIEFDIDPNDDLTLAFGDYTGTSFAAAGSVTSNSKPVVIGSTLDYKREITISNAGSSLTDYQVSLILDTASLIAAGRMQSDGADIRFNDSDDYTDLPYWIEEGINTASTKIWVKVPTLPTGDTTIYMYYGDPYAVPVSNGTRTFEFFDDFDDGDYTANPAWSASGTWTVNNGAAETSSTGHPVLYENSYSAADYVVEGKMRITSSIASGTEQQAWLLFRLSDTDNFYGYGYKGVEATNKWEFWRRSNSNFAELAEHTPQTMTQNTWYKQKIQVAGTSVKTKAWAAGSAEPGSWGIDTADSTHSSGKIGLKGTYVTATVQFDDIFVHQYAATVPTTNAGGEQNVSLDADATLTAGPMSEPATIDSTVNNQADALPVFDFTITDGGGGDGQGVKVIRLIVTRGAADDTGDWTNYIAGAELINGASTLTNPAITADAITFGDGNSMLFTVSDSASQTYALSIWLKPNLTESKVIEFDIDPNDDLAVYFISTGFAPGGSVTSGGKPVISIGAPSSYNYKREITISNSGSALTDYQVKINLDTASLISEGKMQADGDDIRFRDSDDSTLLSYWFDPLYINTSSTDIWVRIPSVPTGDKIIYLYYGNASDSAASDGEAAFEFFDDFSGAGLDTNKWDVMNSGTGSHLVDNDLFSITSTGDWYGTSDASRAIVSKNPFGSTFICEALIDTISATVDHPRFFALRASNATNSRMFVLLGDDNRSHITNVYRDSDGVSAGYYGENSGIINPGNGKIAKFVKNGDAVTSYYDEQLTNSRTITNWNLEKAAFTAIKGGTDKFDWIFVRKYGDPEPTASPGAEQCLATNDTDATLTAGPLVEPAAIDSTITNQASALDVFDFTITDVGGADGLGVVLTRIDITRGGNDTTGDWTGVIAGAELSDGTTTITNNTVTAAAITFGDGNSTLFTVADNTSQTLTLSIWLNGGSDGMVIEFDIDPNDDVTVDCSGSGFAAGGSVTSGSQPVINEVWNYSYKREITISYSGSTLTDYQVKINLNTASLVSEGKMQADGDDIRFRDSNDSTLLSYWFDPAYINTSSTDIWIKVPSLPDGGKTIYLYYGNASDSAAGDGAATFDLFDDFSDGDYTGNPAWTVSSGTWTVNGGALETSSTSHPIISENSYSNTDFIMEGKMRITSSPISGDRQAWMLFRLSDSSNFYGYGYRGSEGTNKWEFWRRSGGFSELAEHTPQTMTQNTWYKQKIQVAGTSIKTKAWAAGSAEPGSWGIDTANSLFASGKIGLKGTALSATVQYDNIFVHQYAVAEPTPNLGAEQCQSSNDTDAALTAGPLSEPATIDSTITNQALALDVFDFTITDGGGGDGLGTALTQIKITRGAADDTGDWTNYIAGAELINGASTLTNPTVIADSITFGDGSATIFTVSDNTSETFTLSVWLTSSLPGDAQGKVIEFDIDPNDDVAIDCTGSGFAAGGSVTSGGQPVVNIVWGYTYKRNVTISYSGSTLSDYQVKINLNTQSLISGGKMQSNGEDIRFKDSDDSTLLSYWFDPAYINSSSTDIWIKVPSIPDGGKTIYMYYGNPSASAAGDGTATFDFFDDFDDGDYTSNPSWTTSGGNWSVISGALQISDGAHYVIFGDSYSGADFVMEGKMRITSAIGGDQQAWMLFRLADSSKYYGYGYRGASGTNRWEFWRRNGGFSLLTYHTPQTMIQDTWYKQKIQAAGSSMKLKTWSAGSVEPAPWGIDTTNTTFSSGKVGLKGPAATAATVQYDNIFVHQYSATEPAPSLGPEY